MKVGHYVWHESLRYLKRRYPKTGVRKLYRDNYRRVKTQYGSMLMFSGRALDKRRDDTFVSITNIAGIRVARTRRSLLLVEKNPFLSDDYSYFEELKLRRNSEAFDYSKIHSNLIRKQRGICPICAELINFGDAIEVDHIILLSEGGKDRLSNMRLIHKYCHRYIVHGKSK